MADDFIKREEYQNTMERLHQRVDKISETGIKIETSVNLMKESVDKMCECVYGNGKSGLTQKITQLFERISLHTKLLTAVILSVLGMAFCIIQNTLNGKP